jgi:3-methyladenine DNA glycosylase AlkD
MHLDEVMQELEAAGTEQNRKIYRRHGAGDNQFGVSFASLTKLKKRIKTDHALAEALWATGNADARSLATMVADPHAFTSSDLDRWAGDAEETRYYLLADLIAHNLSGPGPLAREKAEAWTKADAEYVAQAGWDTLAILALRDESLPDAYFETYLDEIERDIHNRKNRVRHAMNGALIAIGARNEALRRRAEDVAAEIGKVHVDHGQTGCKTPDAASYIARTWATKATRA